MKILAKGLVTRLNGGNSRLNQGRQMGFINDWYSADNLQRLLSTISLVQLKIIVAAFITECRTSPMKNSIGDIK
jgi:hypothetical protein